MSRAVTRPWHVERLALERHKRLCGKLTASLPLASTLICSLLSADTLKAVQYNLLEAKELAVTFLYVGEPASPVQATGQRALKSWGAALD